jgi:hypothetical protein
MKNIKPEKTIGEEIAAQIRGTGTTFTINITMDYDGCQTAILKDNDCGDMTIIQDYGEGPKVMFLDKNEVAALKSILL